MLFGYYTQVLEIVIRHARKEGKYDRGILQLSGNIQVVSEEQVFFDHPSGNSTHLVTVRVDKGVPWSEISRKRDEALAREAPRQKDEKGAKRSLTGFWRSIHAVGGRHFILLAVESHEGDQGRRTVRITRPVTGENFRAWGEFELTDKYSRCSDEDAWQLWCRQYREAGRGPEDVKPGDEGDREWVWDGAK